MLVFAGIAYWKIPDRLSHETERNRFAGVPFLRFGTLAGGVLCVAASGSVPGVAQRVFLIAAAVLLVGLTFRLDRRAANNLFPRGALSLNAPIGLALWILSLHGMTQTSVTLFLPLLLQVVHQVSPVVINFLSIVISMGWTIGTFTVSGWSGKRERVALVSGPVIATTGLACLTAVALLPGLALMTLSAFVMGIGIGIYNVHLVARAMDSVGSDEYRTTASALSSVRSIGTAFGAAIAGVVANVAGLGDAPEPGAVGNAITAVYMFCCIPFGLAALLMFRFVHIVFGRPQAVLADSERSQ
jgi:predicted MFS family arabinose efflux permease